MLFFAGSDRAARAAKSYTSRTYIILRARRFVNSPVRARRRGREKAECLPRGARQARLCAAGEKAHAKSDKIRIYPLSVYQKRRCRPGAPHLTSGSDERRKTKAAPCTIIYTGAAKIPAKKYFLISINNPDASVFSASVISKTATPAGA